MIDLIPVVEAIYRPDLTHRAWLEGLAQALQKPLEAALGVAVWSLHWTGQCVSWRAFVTLGMSRELAENLRRRVEDEAPVRPRARFASAANAGGDACAQLPLALALQGVRDLLSLHALDPEGGAVGVSVPLRAAERQSSRCLQHCEQISAHLASGLRLRALRLQASAQDRLGSVQVGAHEWETGLRGTAVAVDHALRQRLQDSAGAWSDLVHGRWRMIDHFEADGRRYLVVQRSHEQASGALSARQRQVVALRSAGRPLKAIAYEVDCSISTVALDLSKALRALGLRSANELLAPGAAGARGGGWTEPCQGIRGRAAT
jgi:DNA-binding CsgD family transcriptional regulator